MKMVRRPLRPSFGYNDEQRLLKAIGEARTLASLCSGANPSGPRNDACRQFIECADKLGENLTGNPTYFHAKPHG